jgi:hypothetical protein
MTKKRKPNIGKGQKIIIVLLSFTFVSSLVLTKLVIDNSRVNQGEVTVYDQNLENWTANEEDGLLQLRAVNTGSTEDIERINPENVFTTECGYIDQKPENVTLTCGDGGILVREIKWETWRASGASGSGIHSVNQCEPDCASGERIEVPVEVRLSRLMTDGSKFYLTSFNAYSLDGKVLDMGWTFPWEFEDVILAEDGSIATPFLD